MFDACHSGAAGVRDFDLSRLRVLGAVFAAVLAACGGGGDSAGVPAAGSAAGTGQARNATALAADTWTQIASEGQSFAVSGTQTVRFGNTWYGWVQKSVTTSGQCTNAFFGYDPAPGHGKTCELLGTATAAPAPTDGTWTTVAHEGQAFTVGDTQTVRFGTPWYSWITKTVSGAATCSIAFFGSDPDPGKGKQCDVLGTATSPPAPAPAPAPAGSWTQIASEGQSFSVSGTQTVRYGNPWVAWVTKSVSGTGQCSNAFFGSDPAPGKGKTCEVAAATATTVPVASNVWAVIGSSTAQGVGATAGHSWVELMRADNAWRGVSVVGLGVGGSVTYNGLSVSAAVAGKPAPDASHNVDAAMSAGARLLLINYPTNDVAYGYTSDETVGNHLSMRDTASRLGAVTMALSSQPSRGAPSAAQAATFADNDSRLAAAFGACFVAVRKALAMPDDTLNPIYDSGDGQHLNDAGHALVYSLVKQVLDAGLCVKL